MDRDDASHGFTLIETLVALIIFVACYLMIHQTVALGWRGVQVAHAETAALRLAQSRLAAAGVEQPLQDGRQTGRTEGFDWSVQVRPYAQPEIAAPAQRPTGYWVTVDVNWREGPLRRARSLQLSTLKLKSPPR
jgi:general secretion pathway protein I